MLSLNAVLQSLHVMEASVSDSILLNFSEDVSIHILSVNMIIIRYIELTWSLIQLNHC